MKNAREEQHKEDDAGCAGYADFIAAIAAIAGNIKSTNDTVVRRAASGKKEDE